MPRPLTHKYANMCDTERAPKKFEPLQVNFTVYKTHTQIIPQKGWAISKRDFWWMLEPLTNSMSSQNEAHWMYTYDPAQQKVMVISLNWVDTLGKTGKNTLTWLFSRPTSSSSLHSHETNKYIFQNKSSERSPASRENPARWLIRKHSWTHGSSCPANDWSLAYTW